MTEESLHFLSFFPEDPQNELDTSVSQGNSFVCFSCSSLRLNTSVSRLQARVLYSVLWAQCWLGHQAGTQRVLLRCKRQHRGPRHGAFQHSDYTWQARLTQCPWEEGQWPGHWRGRRQVEWDSEEAHIAVSTPVTWKAMRQQGAASSSSPQSRAKHCSIFFFPILTKAFLFHLFDLEIFLYTDTILNFTCGSVVKNLPARWETWVRSLGWEDSPGEGNGDPVQHSCLENPVDRGAWRATVHGVAKSWTRQSDANEQYVPTGWPLLGTPGSPPLHERWKSHARESSADPVLDSHSVPWHPNPYWASFFIC